MMAYWEKVLMLTKLFDKMELIRLLRSDNIHADALARLTSSLATHDSRVIPAECLKEPSVPKTIEEVFCIEKALHGWTHSSPF